jgi:hypothetical protein
MVKRFKTAPDTKSPTLYGSATISTYPRQLAKGGGTASFNIALPHSPKNALPSLAEAAEAPFTALIRHHSKALHEA